MTLTTLDVSNNTALRKLTANNTSITSLDLSQNPAVYYLAFKTNGLTSIDVSNLPLLNYLYCDENELTSIDVSQNPLLYTLSAPSNNLTSLNVANGANSTYLGTLNVTENPDLTCIQIDEAFTPTEWEKDTTAEYNTNCNCIVSIPDATFKAELLANTDINTTDDGEISCEEAAAVTEISVPNKNIADLTGIEAFTNLTKLTCSGNSLTTLDISANTALTYLNAFNNSLTSLDVSANTELYYLSFSNNSVTSYRCYAKSFIRNFIFFY